MAGTAALAGCANESAGGADTLANTGDWLPRPGLRVRPACHRLRRRDVGVAYRRRRVRPAGARAGEGSLSAVAEIDPSTQWRGTTVEESDKERFKDYIRAFTKRARPRTP